ncbi:hypothetical protein BJX99DRAFT_263976 [Aspergillus californicus]
MSAPLNGGLPALDTARILAEAEIPHVLWGWLAIALMGPDNGPTEIEFVIPDAQVDDAVCALVNGGFKLCCNRDCKELSVSRFPPMVGVEVEGRGFFIPLQCAAAIYSHDREHAVASAHFHLDKKYEHYKVLSLHAKSNLLWNFPDITTDIPAANDPFYRLSNDARLGPNHESPGRWTGEGVQPIKILTPWALTDALIYLLCRDWYGLDKLYCLWQRMLPAIIHSRDSEIRDKIEPQFRTFYEYHMLRGPVRENIWRPLRPLRDRLIAENKLGTLPPHDLTHSVR